MNTLRIGLSRQRNVHALRVAALVFTGMLALGEASAADVNLALGKLYVLKPTPNYPPTTDDGDSVQLTDGKYVGGGFWTEKGAVGWVGVTSVSITVDLGAVASVSGAAFSTAAGRSDVTWPDALYLFCSADGATFAYLGDLVSLDRSADVSPAHSFERRRFEAHGLVAGCRFVRFVATTASGPYVFVDEVEVFGSLQRAPLPVPSTAERDGPDLLWKARLRATVDESVDAARKALDEAHLEPAKREVIASRLKSLTTRLSAAGSEQWAGQDEYPINGLHTAALSVIGSIEEAEGRPTVQAWVANPWEPLSQTMRPPQAATAPKGISIVQMSGEVRAGAIDVRNASGESISLAVDWVIDGLQRPRWIEVSRVEWTGDAGGRPVAAALKRLPVASKPAELTVRAGTTVQLWFSFAPEGLSPGVHDGVVLIKSANGQVVKVPIRVDILPWRMPRKLRLNVAGWDYLDRIAADHGAGYSSRVADALRQNGVDVPWATAAVMPFGEFDAGGRQISTPDTSNFDRWLALWPVAARYRVYLSVGERIAGLRMGTPAFRAAVQTWARFWSQYVLKKGIDPARIDLLFVDEPHSTVQVERQLAWARAVSSADTELKLWIDPTYVDASEVPEELWKTADTVCVNRRLFERSPTSYRSFAERVIASGRSLEIYGTDGPATKLDPYVYYRLQSWRAFDLGAKAVGFWGFTDLGGGKSSWREYQSSGKMYSPLFLDGAVVEQGKHLAAIHEGAQDYEYLAMLRDEIERVGSRRGPTPELRDARRVLAAAVQRVLMGAGVDQFPWSAVKDRTVADAARADVAAALRRLQAVASQ